jgi:hypothetical protein
MIKRRVWTEVVTTQSEALSQNFPGEIKKTRKISEFCVFRQDISQIQVRHITFLSHLARFAT